MAKNEAKEVKGSAKKLALRGTTADRAPNFLSSAAHGGDGGDAFDDNATIPIDVVDRPITSIIVRHGSMIDAIQVVYAGTLQPVKHGGDGGSQETFTVPAGQTIVKVEGRSGAGVDGLRFTLSDGTASKWFGGSGGDPWTDVSNNRPLAFIAGRSGSRLDQIRLVFQDLSTLQNPDAVTVEKITTHGGDGGNEFSDVLLFPDDMNVNPITKISVRSGRFVDSIQVHYKDMKTQPIAHGGTGGNLQEFYLDDDEYIVGVSGRAARFVDQLQFLTNKDRKSLQFGGDGGEPFTVTGPRLVGISGRCARFLDKINFHWGPGLEFTYTDFKFDLSDANVRKDAISVTEAKVSNYSSSTQTMSQTLNWSKTDTDSMTFSNAWRIGVKFTYKVSDPLKVVEKSAEISFDYTRTEGRTTSTAVTSGGSTTVNLTVPANSYIVATLMCTRSTGVSVPFTCIKKQVTRLPDGTLQYLDLGKEKGVFNGVSYSEANVTYGPTMPLS